MNTSKRLDEEYTTISQTNVYDGLKGYRSRWIVRRGTVRSGYSTHLSYVLHVYSPSLIKSLDSSANKSKMYQIYGHQNIRKIIVTLQSEEKSMYIDWSVWTRNSQMYININLLKWCPLYMGAKLSDQRLLNIHKKFQKKFFSVKAKICS